MSVSKIIEKAVDTFPDSVYLRATDFNANQEAGDIALKGKTLFVYNNLPNINVIAETGRLALFPISIRILQLVDTDANTADEDEIREALVPVAHKLFNVINENGG